MTGWDVAPDLLAIVQRPPSHPEKVLLVGIHRWSETGLLVLPTLSMLHQTAGMGAVHGRHGGKPSPLLSWLDMALGKRALPTEGTVATIVDKFTRHELSSCCIFSRPRTGTSVELLKSGFFHIARQTGAVVRFFGMDPDSKRVNVSQSCIPPADIVKHTNWEEFCRSENVAARVAQGYNEVQGLYHYTGSWSDKHQGLLLDSRLANGGAAPEPRANKKKNPQKKHNKHKKKKKNTKKKQKSTKKHKKHPKRSSKRKHQSKTTASKAPRAEKGLPLHEKTKIRQPDVQFLEQLLANIRAQPTQ